MGKFKKGDFVRVTDNKGAPYDYRVGDVHKVDAVLAGLVYVLGKPGMFAKRFEPWQPRVGERVRYTGKSTIYSERELVGLEGEVTELNGNLVNIKWDKAIVDGIRTGGAKYIENIEPILTAAQEQPATLKIKAGKFYKTRDGRKVGPIIANWCDNEHWPFRWPEHTMYYKPNGFSCPGSAHLHRDADDLVAEWIDEPAAKASNDNAKPKFKVGDRVVLTADNPQSPSFGVKGAIGKIGSIEGESARVTFETGPHAGDFWYVPVSVLAAYYAPAVKNTTAIVALIENGQPKPSSTPHVHASTVAAEKEAKRLAAKYKGKQFGVFTLTTTHEEAAPVYDHKWQNMAALGLKIDAIKELRAVAGLDLLSAKRAVEAFENAA